MLARNAFRIATTRHLLRPPVRQQRRTLVTELVSGAAEQFVDLSLALPWPATWLPYTSTIVLLTVLSRTALLPVFIWGKKKQFIVEDVVIPELKRNVQDVQQRAARDLKLERGHDTLPPAEKAMVLDKRISSMMEARRKELFSALDCSPMKAVVIPAVMHLAVFVPMTVLFGAAAMPPTPLDSEGFWTITTLTHPDQSNVLPIALGLLTIATTDSSRWFISSERLHELKERDQRNLEKSRKSTLKFNVGSFFMNFARLSSIARVVLGMVVPGSVLTYWLTSAAYGLLQAWAFQWWSRRRANITVPVPPLRIGRRL